MPEDFDISEELRKFFDEEKERRRLMGRQVNEFTLSIYVLSTGLSQQTAGTALKKLLEEGKVNVRKGLGKDGKVVNYYSLTGK